MWLVLCAFVIPSVFCALLGLYLCIYHTHMASVTRDESVHLLYATKRQMPSPPLALMNFSLPIAPTSRRLCPLPPPSHFHSSWQLPSPILPPPAYSENEIWPMAFGDPVNSSPKAQHFINQPPKLCSIAMPNYL
uniref:Uncharacterized protein n=1 Tax=Globodera rostochiensis TaxID=31243 RepID=A0A914GVP0_GLORO